MSLRIPLSVVAALGVGGWVGSLITNWLTTRRERAQRAVQFRQQQLEEFYGPLLAMPKEIRARSELRVKLQQAIDQKYAVGLLSAGLGKTEETSDAQLPTITASIQDEAATFRNVLMPRYREMIDVFRQKMWLAEPETRGFFAQLVEYVDVWDKILAHTLPPSVAGAVGHTEKNLLPFYKHLEEVHDRLRSKVS